MVILAVLASSFLWLGHWNGTTDTNEQVNGPSIGNVETVKVAYTRWKSAQAYDGNASLLRLPLGYIKGISSEFTQAKGNAILNLVTGSFVVDIAGLPAGQDSEVWLVDNRNDSQSENVRNATKAKVKAGVLHNEQGIAHLEVLLNAEDLWGFELDRVVVTHQGEDLQNGVLVAGSPSLFQRLYFQERRGFATLAQGGSDDLDAGDPSGHFGFVVPAPAFAQQGGANLDALIAQGEDLFFNETFNGNGRTCGTCHRAENNFTIDPAFIATLPGDDPLFVAENNEDLAELEDPTLMRQFGLIRANVDGFEDPASKFVMRSVSHMLGMSLSIQSVATEPPFEMTGWSGDGAPGNGTLRDFATGAVTQHFTKTLDRVVDEDFRLPTDAELDAIEAFTFSLGRQDELNLEELELADRNAERGRILFITEDSQNRTVASAKCTICHGNAGALTVGGANQNFETGVEDMLHPAAVLGQALPRDEGFGTQLNQATGGFGDGSFNTTSVVEAADTAPYFHHNGAETLEDAIAFYDSPEFRNSIEGQRLILQDSGGQELSVDVDTLAAFLRVVNALDNIRAVTDLLDRAKLSGTVAGSQKLLHVAQADLEDAVQVLNESELHEEDAVPNLEEAQSLVDSAANAGNTSERDGFIDEGIAKVQAARTFMVVAEGTSVVPPAPTPDPNPAPQPDPTPVVDTPPTVTILSPANGTRVAEIITISADAVDDTGIAKVIFQAGTTLLGEVLTAPFLHDFDTTTVPDGTVIITVTAVDLNNQNSQLASTSLLVDNILDPPPPPVRCTVYSCPSPPPPPTTPPPPPVILPSSSSPDGEFEGEVLDKDVVASTVTVSTEDGPLTLKITSSTDFKGSIAFNFHTILIGHIVQGEFFTSVGEALWIEADLPPGL